MGWRIGLASLMAFIISQSPLVAGADVQQSTYSVTITSPTSTSGHGPLSGLLPQTSELQQWVLVGIGLLILSLLMLLLKLWWPSRQTTTREQP